MAWSSETGFKVSHHNSNLGVDDWIYISGFYVPKIRSKVCGGMLQNTFLLAVTVQEDAFDLCDWCDSYPLMLP